MNGLSFGNKEQKHTILIKAIFDNIINAAIITLSQLLFFVLQDASELLHEL